MTYEEALAKGYTWHEIQHSMKRRSPWHDYHNQGTYMLTLEVNGRQPLLGTLVCDDRGPHVDLSELGEAIFADEVAKMSHYYPMLEVWKVCLMPDHIHMIVRVKEDMPAGKHLGQVVRGFKTGCSRAWWRICGGDAPQTMAHTPPQSGTMEPTQPGPVVHTPTQPVPVPAIVASASPEALRPVLFASGYNDKILQRAGQLDRWKAYLDDNPRRLWVKRQNPQFFTILNEVEIADHRCQCVGNRFLLDIPDKVAVIVHRRYTDADNARLRTEWLACGDRGGVLVSASIHPKEREVIREAKALGYRVIELMENGFPPLYKPYGEAFDACAEGRLLQVSPWEHHNVRKVITRAQCLELNQMAEFIAEM